MSFELAPKLKAFIEKVGLKINFLSGNTFSINIVTNAPAKPAPGTVSVQQLPPDLKEALRQAILEYHENGQPLLTEKSAGLLDYVQHHQKEGNAVIDALHGIIRAEDILALRAAYIIKTKSEAGEDINELRDGLIRKYGERGRKLTNLTSSGYVDSVILPTYIAMRQAPDYQVRYFVDFYDAFVDESGFAVFVNSSMSADGAAAEILKKLARNRSYGKYYVHVHGLGIPIVETIVKAVKALRQKNLQIAQVNEKRVGGSIFVRLEWVPDVEPPQLSK